MSERTKISQRTMTAAGCPREYELASRELTADPYAGFADIREEAPVARGRLADGALVWIVSRHEDVSAVLTDPRFVSNSESVPGATADLYADSLTKLGIPRNLVPYLSESLTHLDPPDHTRLRKLATRAFSARRVSGLMPRLQALTDELVAALPSHAVNGTVDLIKHLAYPLPITIICELIGVPAQDRTLWRTWSQDYSDICRLGSMLADSSAYIRALAEQRRIEPADDLITELVQAHDADGDRLSDAELITMVLTLMIAGHETTAHLIGNSILALLTHPDQLSLFREQPALAAQAVQELLRWCSPVLLAKPRYAAEDMMIAGTLIKRGDVVLPVLGSANHDPRHFPDPERLDITRRPDMRGVRGVPHLAYSYGAHYCMGSTLANQETELALGAIMRRYPDLALAVPEGELSWRPVPGTRQLVALPVALGSPAATGTCVR